MSGAKWLLLALLAVPVAELAVFVLVAAAIGFGPALALALGTSLVGALVLRYAGGAHIARFRAAKGAGRLAGVQADAKGFLTLLAGILLLFPGFITDLLGLVLLIPPLRRWLGAALRGVLDRRAPAARADAVVDLKPGEWRQVPEDRLADQRDSNRNP